MSQTRVVEFIGGPKDGERKTIDVRTEWYRCVTRRSRQPIVEPTEFYPPPKLLTGYYYGRGRFMEWQGEDS